MIDKKHIGRRSKLYSVDVEKGPLVFFSNTVMEQDPIYFDESAARAAGHPTILAPPTYVFSISLAHPEAARQFIDLDIDPKKAVLHVKQQFDYLNLVYAGDTISFQNELIDVFEKKAGALEFFVSQITGTNQHGVEVVKMAFTCVIRH